jgi:hypothetical protein
MTMGSQVSPNDFINITRPQSRAPSMNGEAFVAAPRPKRPVKKQAPQKSIDEFWNKFTTKHPGKIFTILPDNLYAKRAAAHAPKGSIPGKNALASYEEAVHSCKTKVAKIVKECRRLNQKYRDPHFDIEADFKRTQAFPEIPPDCLTTLNEEQAVLQPMSVKRVEVWQRSCPIDAQLTFSTGHIRKAPVLHRRRNRKRCTTR